VALVVKNPPANAGDIRDMGSITGSGRSPGGGNGNPLYSYLENPHTSSGFLLIVFSNPASSYHQPKQKDEFVS